MRSALEVAGRCLLVALTATTGASCGASRGEEGVAASGAGASGAGASGVGLEPGPAAPGWQRAYADGAVALSCAMSLAEVQAAGAPALSFGDATLAVGFEQVSATGQDPIVVRFDGGTQTYCRAHETGGPDGRAHGLTWDGGPAAYVVYTVVGGGSGIEAATQGGWMPSYGSGGGPKVTVLGRLVAATGELDAGTFIIAKKKDGKTNTHAPAGAPTKLAAGGVELLGESAFQPLSPDGTLMECSDYPFFTRSRFDDALATLTCASSTNCTGTTPCE